MPPRDGVLINNDKSFWRSDSCGWRHDSRPKLIVSVRRLDGAKDGEPDVVRLACAPNAHSRNITHVMLVGLSIPGAGCCEVNADYQGATLSFVAWVP